MPTITIIDNPKIKTSELLAKCKEKFLVWCLWNDEELDKNFPPPEKETTKQFKKQVEPDVLNKSYDDMEKEGIENITLRERIIFELDYFNETGKHLDIEGITITSSRAGDDVASAYWYRDYRRFRVNSYYRDARYPRYGGRQAISLNLSPLITLSFTQEEYKTLKSALNKILKL
jgi:hypothetical protein